MPIVENAMARDKVKVINHKSTIDKMPFDLRHLIANFCTQLGPELAQRGFYLATTISPLMPRFFKGNPLGINDLLNNIIHYSQHYLSEGGITISVDSEPTNNHQHLVSFAITVSGQCIPANTQRTIFQARNSSTANEIISGKSNLYIAKIITTIMGGSISVANTFGCGTSYLATINLEVIADQLTN